MNPKEIQQLVNPILLTHNVKLYSIKTKKEYGENILEILIDEETMSYDKLEVIHVEILDAINDLLPNGYFLEVASVGIERPIKSLEEAEKAIGSYIYIESSEYRGNATLEKIEDGNLVLKYFVKGKPKTHIINYDKIEYIRKAVKV